MDAVSPPMPLNGESKELVVASRLVDEVESARMGRGAIEDRGSVRRSVRELRVREAIVKRVVVVGNREGRECELSFGRRLQGFSNGPQASSDWSGDVKLVGRNFKELPPSSVHLLKLLYRTKFQSHI